jgi:hypothetical protein
MGNYSNPWATTLDLRLFSEHNAQGVQASVYNVTAKNWIAPPSPWMISNTEKTER